MNLPARREAFRALHERGCFVIPNPWDAGSARYFQRLGFPALATTSAGFAFSQGLPDSGEESVLGRDRNLAYLAGIVAAVDVPAVAPRPFNLLVVQDIGLNVEQIAALGVRRISVGGALALAAWTGFMPVAERLRSKGSFAGLARLVPYAEINAFFAGTSCRDSVER
jgi:2-methylisocitrate lyase-like PEP mutase family enzyme